MTAVAAFGGSLRRESFNTKLLRAAVELAPDDMDATIAEIDRLPLYNADRDECLGGGPEPAPVMAFREAIEISDGMLIVTPEYNWSVPGYIKNAIDWVSRPAFESVLAGRPTLIMGASRGAAGTGRAQLHLRQILLSTRTPVMLESLELPFAREHFDEDGRLDQETAVRVRGLMALLAEEIELAAERSLVRQR